MGSFTWPRVAEDSHATAPSVRAEVRETAGVLVLLSINQVGYIKLSQISPIAIISTAGVGRVRSFFCTHLVFFLRGASASRNDDALFVGALNVDLCLCSEAGTASCFLDLFWPICASIFKRTRLNGLGFQLHGDCREVAWISDPHPS